MKYYFTDQRGDDNTAFKKAPADIAAIAESMGFVGFAVTGCAVNIEGKCQLVQILKLMGAKFRWMLVSWRYYHFFKKGDIILVQATPPFFNRTSGRELLRRLCDKGVRFIYLIHDIGELREEEPCKSVSRFLFWELVACCEVVIAHNSVMKRWLVEHGVADEKIVTLEIFDYLLPNVDSANVMGVVERNVYEETKTQVVVAGNMSARKAKYLSGLKRITGVDWCLYGPYYDPIEIEDHSASITYFGSYPSDILPQKLKGAWGLVWDGDSITSCSGVTGEYLRYNNPHKLSLYLAMGIPVVIWSQAAEAEFVRREGAGILVDSLGEIPAAIAAVTYDKYAQFLNSARMLADKLRQGLYSRMALSHCLEKITREGR